MASKSTLPLSELPVNHAGRIGAAKGFSDISMKRQPDAMASNPEDKTSFLRNSSSIQSMLRNTTETGDVGQFSIKPTRLPHPVHRPRPPQRAVTRNESSRRHFTRDYHHSHEDFHRSFVPTHPISNASSNVISLHNTQRQRSYRAPVRESMAEDGRSNSIGQRSYHNHNVAHPRPHTSNRFQGQGDVYAMRPRSPYAYPTRLKRPGYRPWSPALSDLSRSGQGLYVDDQREPDFRARSPISVSALQRAPLPWQTGYSQFDSSFRYHPPFTISNRPSSTSLSCMPTPGPSSGLDPSSFTSKKSLAPQATSFGEESSQCHTSLPVFYDYTEAFEEENHFQISIASLSEQEMIEKEENIYHELDGDQTTVNLSELPTNETTDAISQTRINDTQECPSPPNSNHMVFKKTHQSEVNENCPYASSPENSETLSCDDRHQSDTKARLLSSDYVEINKKEKLKTASPQDFRRQHLGLAISRRSIISSNHALNFTSSSESMYSTQSAAGHGFSILDRQTEPERSVKHVPNAILKSSSPKSGQPNVATRRNGMSCPIPAPGTMVSDPWCDSKSSQIYAPTPERLPSTPGQQDRFSRIFSIDERSKGLQSYNKLASEPPSEANLPNKLLDENMTDGSEILMIASPETQPCLTSKLERKSFEQESETSLDLKKAQKKMEAEHALEKEVTLENKSQPRTGLSFDRTHTSKSVSNLSDPPKPTSVRNSIPCWPLPLTAQNDRVGIATDTRARNSAPCPSAVARSSTLSPSINKLPSMSSLPSFRSYSPPFDLNPTALPFHFTPLSVSERKKAPLNNNFAEGLTMNEKDASPTPQLQSEKVSVESSPGSRPWNLDTSYPWADQPPALEVSLPETTQELEQDTSKLPRFKLKIQRASSTVLGHPKLARPLPLPLETTANRKASISSDLFRSGTFRCRSRPSVTITQHNSSHTNPAATPIAVYPISPLSSSILSPRITLVPPSPGLNLEVRSFFSDDSSQLPPKGSLRKRLSQLRAIAARANSSEDVRGADRGLLSSAMGRSRASGRTSRQGRAPSEGLYNLRHVRWRIEERFKDWLHRGKDRFRYWGGRITRKGSKERVGSADLYAGV